MAGQYYPLSAPLLNPMRRDERLIDLFLHGYKDRAGNSYRLNHRPDQAERAKPAIDCIAVNDRDESLAIEHTLVEPFEGQKADDQSFLAVFERLHHSVELTMANLLINVLVPVGVIPKGVDWNEIGERVFEWFREARVRVTVGESDHEIPGLAFALTVHVEVMEIPDSPGVLVVGRISPKNKSFSEVLRKALTAKLPKLVGTNANKRILLLEDASMVLGLAIFSREIDAAQGDFPDLAQVDSIWLANSSVWESEKVIFFFHVWPNGVRERFKIEDK